MTWKAYVCRISDKPAMVLVDDRFAEQATVPPLAIVSWFGVYCNRPAGNSFWDPAETDVLDRIEDDLIGLCGALGDGRAVYVLRIATWGIREYYVYHSVEADMDRVCSALKAIYPEYRIELDKLSDPDWIQYKKYV